MLAKPDQEARGTTGLHVMIDVALSETENACKNIPVGSMNITSDQSDPHTRHWLHTKTAQHFYMAVAASKQHQVLDMVQPEEGALPSLSRQQAGGCCTFNNGEASMVARPACAVELDALETADSQNPWL